MESRAPGVGHQERGAAMVCKSDTWGELDISWTHVWTSDISKCWSLTASELVDHARSERKLT